VNNFKTKVFRCVKRLDVRNHSIRWIMALGDWCVRWPLGWDEIVAYCAMGMTTVRRIDEGVYYIHFIDNEALDDPKWE